MDVNIREKDEEVHIWPSIILILLSFKFVVPCSMVGLR